MRKPLELYIHIPFCVKKCNYCDFPSAPGTAAEQEAYVKKLIQKIESYREFAAAYQVETIFIGGGTPSLLTGSQIVRILEQIHQIFRVKKNAETTIEANPGTVSAKKLRAYLGAGINRLSLGLQTTIDSELQSLGRIHTFEDFLQTFDYARQTGFTNINVDLMSAIPRQTFATWAASLKKIAGLGPEHISAYSLIIEEGTPFYRDQNKLTLPSEEEERLMYKATQIILREFGYHRYEISNYARAGYECRHNLGYWERRDYLGIGYRAASLIDNVRFTEDGEREVLTREHQMEEFMFLGLRKTAGISVRQFEQTFGRKFDRVYGRTLKKLCREGLLQRRGEWVSLTEKGVDISNYVMSEFLF